MPLASILWFSLVGLPAHVNPTPVDPVGWLQKVNDELTAIYRESIHFTWEYMTGQTSNETAYSAFNVSLDEWKQERCKETKGFPRLGQLMSRAVMLVCRGPTFISRKLEGEMSSLMQQLVSLYSHSKLCLSGRCYSAEPDLDKLMRTSRDPDLLLWAWEGWRRIVAGPGLRMYPRFIQLQNVAAQLNGYGDIGECWREELEIPDLAGEAESLVEEMRPFHRLLHAFVRHRLRQHYGQGIVSKEGPLPAHILGGMWGQSWESIMDILVNSTLNLDGAVEKRFSNVHDMVLEAEKYYVSIGLEPMTEKFWKYSIITKPDNPYISCHGSAANLHDTDDYRMLLCASLTWDDYCVIHHELGHIEYYMAYKNLPFYFKEAANSAFQESIGDLIMLALETPQHMKRLGIIEQGSEDIEMFLLLHQALKKIPHLMFSYNIEKWRWGVMASNISVEDYNKVFWEYRTANEGIQPPLPRPAGSFDPIAKFHIAGNTPYIRYFFSDFLIFQFHDVLCQMKNAMYKIEDEEVHLCDLYGFKEAGEKLRLMMSHGSMYKWNIILDEFSGGKYKKISAEPLLKYYQPLIKWLQEIIRKENIPIGW